MVLDEVQRHYRSWTLCMRIPVHNRARLNIGSSRSSVSAVYLLMFIYLLLFFLQIFRFCFADKTQSSTLPLSTIVLLRSVCVCVCVFMYRRHNKIIIYYYCCYYYWILYGINRFCRRNRMITKIIKYDRVIVIVVIYFNSISLYRTRVYTVIFYRYT
jgi:hypothetical protein